MKYPPLVSCSFGIEITYRYVSVLLEIARGTLGLKVILPVAAAEEGCVLRHAARCHCAGNNGVVVADPPWYEDETIGLLWTASTLSGTGASVLLSLPPVETRPGIDAERERIRACRCRVRSRTRPSY